VITVLGEWIILYTRPVVTKIIGDTVDLVKIKVRDANWNRFLQLETSAVPFKHDYGAWRIFFMTSITKLEVIKPNRSMVKTKTKKLKKRVDFGNVVNI